MATEWREFTFSELIGSGALEIGDGYRAKLSELGGDGPIFLRAGHVTDTHIDFAGVDRFNRDAASHVASKMSRPGDVIVTTKGNSTGRVAFVDSGVPSFVYSPHLSYWRSLDQGRIVPKFLRYWSRSPEFRNQLAGLATSTDMAPYLSLVDQRRLRVILPSPEEQKAISRILCALDDKIELNRRMNETMEAMARAIFKSWFVDFDPVRAKTEGRQPFGMDAETAALFPNAFQDSPLGKIPKGWAVRGLDTVAHFLNGLALQKYPPNGKASLPVIKIAQLHKGNAEGADQATGDLPSEYVVEDGDVLFSWSGSLDLVLWCGGRGALNQHLFKVTSRDYPKWFYYLWIRAHLSGFQLIAAGKATTMGHIQRHHLNEAKVLVPPNDLLASMDKIFDPMIQAIVENAIQSRTLVSIRDALLPKLISGEIRVPFVRMKEVRQ
jgi:type I restriction enzyme S subunit